MQCLRADVPPMDWCAPGVDVHLEDVCISENICIFQEQVYLSRADASAL